MIEEILRQGEIEVQGRLVDASNATLLISLSHNGATLDAIYKPVAGERPLWDFPDGNLAQRERAAYLISEAMNINCVPLTILRDGPFGVGMVQQWIDIDESVQLEDFFHSDDPQLRMVALFDAVINNTDRKIGHLIPDLQQKLYVCDHGVTFHVDDKLRTVLWQWAGQTFTENEIRTLDSLLTLLRRNQIEELPSLITSDEITALTSRVESLLTAGTFPEPNPEWPHIPWPPF